MFDVFFTAQCNQVNGDEIEVAECSNGDVEISIGDNSVILSKLGAMTMAYAIASHYKNEEK
jgi:hypothetical protein